MRDDVKLSLAAVVLMAVCCGGPVVLSLLVSGAALGALGSVWSGGRLLLPVSGALLIAAVAASMVRISARWLGSGKALGLAGWPSARGHQRSRVEHVVSCAHQSRCSVCTRSTT